ncbi:succinate dehydrogenase assembly factor 2 [Legionella shakespearei]|uniref:FAD assembly factor SdhE n=1 Tax=Legionella shakespearei DSM 23087 TaxID=1122169 RepID=A0A0W0Z0Y2_9GAMM|nr:succinate dehydrogenase assembly factor 2 [Legionella shakespearei]KTD62770.1 Antitoxin CptB [Legionella shakespearei DSM 23087]
MLDAREKARFEWHCRRGMLELDLILQQFLAKGLDKLSAKEIKAFDLLLTATDPELYSWLMGYEEPQDEELKAIVAIVRNNH